MALDIVYPRLCGFAAALYMLPVDENDMMSQHSVGGNWWKILYCPTVHFDWLSIPVFEEFILLYIVTFVIANLYSEGLLFISKKKAYSAGTIGNTLS